MKKIFVFALAAACALTACDSKNGATATTGDAVAREVGASDVAYVQVEAVLAQCDLYKNEGVALQEKTQKAQESWAKKERSLQAEAAQLQEKYEKGLITTRDAQSTQENIQKRVASYQASAQKEAQTRRSRSCARLVRPRPSTRRTWSSPTVRRTCCAGRSRRSMPTRNIS